MAEGVVVSEDVSRYGLHRLHVIRGGVPPAREAWLAGIQDGGQVEAIAEWHDPSLNFYHLYIAWRSEMIESSSPIWSTSISGNLVEAVGRAAEKFHQRFGAWPNQAITRANGEQDPGPNSVTLGSPQGDDIGKIRIHYVEKGWQPGTVGVYLLEDEDDEGEAHAGSN
jgi:hypothetical protein